MSWRDTFALMAQVQSSPRYKPATSFGSSFRTRGSFGGSQGSTGASRINWNDLASGRLATNPSGANPSATADKNPIQSGAQAKGIDTLQVALPYSSGAGRSPYAPPSQAAPLSTKGDLLGSLQAEAGALTQNINLGNFMPYFMERINTAAHDLADAHMLPGEVGAATDGFINVVDAASQVVGPVMEALPKLLIDHSLDHRAQLYRAIANGETPDFGMGGAIDNPIQGFGDLVNTPFAMIGRTLEHAAPTGPIGDVGRFIKTGGPAGWLFGQSTASKAEDAKYWQSEMLHAVDPQRRLDAEQRMSILRDSIDLPESVKLQIEGNPQANDEELAKWMNEAPEGKAWSYQGGVPTLAQNIGTPLLLYIAELKGAGSGLKVGQAFAGSEGLGLPGVPGITRGITVGGRTIPSIPAITLKLQTASVAAGLGITAVNTTMGTIARYQGDEAAIAWFDNANRSTEFSDDPMVQLVTGFSVNPFQAVKMLGKGIVATKHGIEFPIDKVTGAKLLTHYTSEDQMLDRLALMYKVSKGEASTMLDAVPGRRAQAYDHVMQPALDEVLDRLPADERIAINLTHPDPVERSGFVLSQYSGDALDLWARDPKAVAGRFHDYDWNKRMMRGPFNPEVAAAIAFEDFRGAMNRSHDIRAREGWTVGYREAFPPQAQALAKAAMDHATVDGSIRMRDFQDLQRQFPVLGRHTGGFIKGDKLDSLIPRTEVDKVLDAATADWAHQAKINPVRAATGADPVLRPDSPTKLRDHAEALGTSIETVQAYSDGSAAVVKDAAKVDLLRQYLVQHADMDPAVVRSMEPQAVYERAFSHINERIAPWEAMGERVVGAQKQLTSLQAELVRVKRAGGATEHDTTVRLQRQMAELTDLVRIAGDPVRPFATQAGARSFRGLRGEYESAIASLEAGGKATDPVTGTAVGPEQLGALRNRLAMFDPADAGHDSHLAEMAARKVDALDRLRVLNSLDEQLDPLSLTQRDLDNVVTGADGELAWATEVTVPPADLTNAFGAFRTASMQTYQTSYGGIGKVRQLALSNKGMEFLRDFDASPASYQWAQIADSPGFVKALRKVGDQPFGSTGSMTGNQLADLVEGAGLSRGVTGRPIDDIAALMGEGVTRDEALQKLAEMKAARDTALDGKGPGTLKRTAATKVPDDYRLQAEADQAARALVYDAEYEAFWHPRNIAKVGEITTRVDELYPGLREVVKGDPALEEGIAKVADRLGRTTDQILDDPQYAAAVKAELVPPGFEPPIEGMIAEHTDLDFLIRANDQEAIAALSDQFAAARAEPRPPQRVSLRAAERLAKMPKTKRSYQYRRQLSDAAADFKDAPNPAILDDPANKLGIEVLSVINHGIGGTKPATNDGVIALLKAIEDGDAGRMGIGPEMQAEAQRVGRALMDDAVKAAKADPNRVGTFTRGVFPEDEQALAQTLDDLMTYDQRDPLGTLQYGLKKAPKDAVIMEWSKIPGLAEELFSRRFQPYEQRLGTTHVRQGLNWVFGPHSNASIRLATKNKWSEALGAKGLSPSTAEAIWNRLQKEANDSRTAHAVKAPDGTIRMRSGDNPMYAGIHNLPNDRMNAMILGRDGKGGFLDELLTGKDPLTSAERLAATKVDYAQAFRESSSFIRGSLADKGPLGKALAESYGMVAHNKAVTTYYYWFRFGLDVRMHAMNYLEAQFLAAGRAGLRKGEIDEGLLGQTEGFLRNMDSDPVSNTGYQFSQDRFGNAYGVFLKEQPDALRGAIAETNQATMQAAWEQMARSDPQLQDMIRNLDGTPNPAQFLKAADAWHARMLKNVDEAGDAKTIDDALAAEMRDTPELAQVFGRLGQVNKDLWGNVRETFYGNPNRSRAERFLNSYMMFWPLSYQIKSTKWFLKVLFDKAGGIQTNALGAVVLDRLADTHNRLLSTDPEYRDWMEKHQTLIFVAQMLFPVSFDQTGVTLNPILRGLFFERDITKAGDIGPVYTYNHVLRPLADEIRVDLYPAVKDLPVLGKLFTPAGVK